MAPRAPYTIFILFHLAECDSTCYTNQVIGASYFQLIWKNKNAIPDNVCLVYNLWKLAIASPPPFVPLPSCRCCCCCCRRKLQRIRFAMCANFFFFIPSLNNRNKKKIIWKRFWKRKKKKRMKRNIRTNEVKWKWRWEIHASMEKRDVIIFIKEFLTFFFLVFFFLF